MSKSMIRTAIEAMRYSKHVAMYVECGAIPRPPETPEELLVITEEFPHLLPAYLPLLVMDTPTRRAAVRLVAEVPDWL